MGSGKSFNVIKNNLLPGSFLISPILENEKVDSIFPIWIKATPNLYLSSDAHDDPMR